MTQANQQQHSRKDASRACRNEPRPCVERRERLPRWVRPLRRLHRALDYSSELLESTFRTVWIADDSAAERPLQTSRTLHRASYRLSAASAHLSNAARNLDAITEAALLEPERAAEVPQLLIEATLRWFSVAGDLALVSDELYGLHSNVYAGLKSGEIVPEPVEPPTHRRRRIVVKPHIVFARDFLLHRRKRALDRIASVPKRRRPAAPMAATDAPRQISRGRAPPPTSNCLL